MKEQTILEKIQKWNFYSKNNFKILTCWLRWYIGFSSRIPKIYVDPRGIAWVSHPCISYALSQDPVGKTIRLAAIS